MEKCKHDQRNGDEHVDAEDHEEHARDSGNRPGRRQRGAFVHLVSMPFRNGMMIVRAYAAPISAIAVTIVPARPFARALFLSFPMMSPSLASNKTNRSA